MRRNLYLFAALIVLTAAFWIISMSVYGDKPGQFVSKQRELEDLNEQLITAQILSQKLNRVYTLFERNLALSRQDSLAEDASLPFLNSLTQILEDLDIDLLSLKPRPRDEHPSYVLAPYDLTIQCTFQQFGDLVAALEKSPRLVNIVEYSVSNSIDRISRILNEEDLNRPVIEMQINTMTLVKSASRSS